MARTEICLLCGVYVAAPERVLVAPWGAKRPEVICMVCAGRVRREYERKLKEDGDYTGVPVMGERGSN